MILKKWTLPREQKFTCCLTSYLFPDQMHVYCDFPFFTYTCQFSSSFWFARHRWSVFWPVRLYRSMFFRPTTATSESRSCLLTVNGIELLVFFFRSTTSIFTKARVKCTEWHGWGWVSMLSKESNIAKNIHWGFVFVSFFTVIETTSEKDWLNRFTPSAIVPWCSVHFSHWKHYR